MRIRRWLVVPLIAALALTSGGDARAASRIRIVVSGAEKQIYLPAKLAEQLGFFADEGLDVELLSAPAGVDAEDEMLAGAVQGVVGFYDHTIDLQAKGKFVESVVQLSNAPGEAELCATRRRGGVTSVAQWKGKTLGVTGLGSSTYFLTQYIALRGGVRPAEFTTVPVGAGATFIAALKQGRIDCGMTTEPTVSLLLAGGDVSVLVDLRDPAATAKVLGGTYPAAALYMPNAWVDVHRVETQKLVNAFVRALRYIATHSAEQIADKVPADYYAGNKPLYVRALIQGRSAFTPDGKMPENGPRTVLAVLNACDRAVQGKTIDLSRTYTTAFAEAAARSLR